MSEKRAFTAIAADVRSAQNGDGEAMNRILADVQDMVYYNCLKMLRDEQAAQDTTQEILIAVYQKLGALSDPQAYVGWVKRITANLCKNRLCKVNREFLLSVNEDGEDPFADFEDTDEQRIPDKALDNEETRRMIADLVDRLPDEQRMCVLLYYYDELKTHEIAETLKVSEGTIKSRLNYARKSIREGVRAYEKAGVKLYGFSPIPFLAYFLGKAAASTVSPVAAASITGASTATAATAATASTASAASAGGIGAFLATTAGKVVAGIAAAVVLGGAVTGTVIATRSPKESVPAIVQTETEQPSETPVVVHTAAPTAQPTPAPTAEPTEEPTPVPETPEEKLQSFTGLPSGDAAFFLEKLYQILAGDNAYGYVNGNPVTEIREIHSMDAYRAFRETDAWEQGVPESELPCYAVYLADGTCLYIYLGDGRPQNGGPAQDWDLYRVRYMGFADGREDAGQWTEWSTERPPADAAKTEQRTQWRYRAAESWGIYECTYPNWAGAEQAIQNDINGILSGAPGCVYHHIASENRYVGEWRDGTAPEDVSALNGPYADRFEYKTEIDEETGESRTLFRIWSVDVDCYLFSAWTAWQNSDPGQVPDSDDGEPAPGSVTRNELSMMLYHNLSSGSSMDLWQETQTRTIYRYCMLSVSPGDYLYYQDYLEGPVWSEWSETKPPEDALEVQTQVFRRGRWKNYADGMGYADCATKAEWEALVESEKGQIRRDGYPVIVTSVRRTEDSDWVYLGERDNLTWFQDCNYYNHTASYRIEETDGGRWNVWKKEKRMCVDGVCYTDWSKWYSEAEAAPYELRDYHFFYTGDLSDCAYAWTFKPDWELEERTFYRYRRR